LIALKWMGWNLGDIAEMGNDFLFWFKAIATLIKAENKEK